MKAVEGVVRIQAQTQIKLSQGRKWFFVYFSFSWQEKSCIPSSSFLSSSSLPSSSWCCSCQHTEHYHPDDVQNDDDHHWRVSLRFIISLILSISIRILHDDGHVMNIWSLMRERETRVSLSLFSSQTLTRSLHFMVEGFLLLLVFANDCFCDFRVFFWLQGIREDMYKKPSLVPSISFMYLFLLIILL